MEEVIRLKELRNSLKLSQADFASEIGMLQQQYSRYEKGEREPQIKHIKKICRTFNVSSDWLLGLNDEKGGKYT